MISRLQCSEEYAVQLGGLNASIDDGEVEQSLDVKSWRRLGEFFCEEASLLNGPFIGGERGGDGIGSSPMNRNSGHRHTLSLLSPTTIYSTDV
jgi:hypothetical protein